MSEKGTVYFLARHTWYFLHRHTSSAPVIVESSGGGGRNADAASFSCFGVSFDGRPSRGSVCHNLRSSVHPAEVRAIGFCEEPFGLRASSWTRGTPPRRSRTNQPGEERRGTSRERRPSGESTNTQALKGRNKRAASPVSPFQGW